MKVEFSIKNVTKHMPIGLRLRDEFLNKMTLSTAVHIGILYKV